MPRASLTPIFFFFTLHYASLSSPLPTNPLYSLLTLHHWQLPVFPFRQVTSAGVILDSSLSFHSHFLTCFAYFYLPHCPLIIFSLHLPLTPLLPRSTVLSPLKLTTNSSYSWIFFFFWSLPSRITETLLLAFHCCLIVLCSSAKKISIWLID